MTTALVAVFALSSILEILAIFLILKSKVATPGQKILQILLVLFIPLFGPLGIISFYRGGKEFDRGDFPRDPGINPHL